MNSKNLCQFEGRIARDPVFSQINTANGPMDKAMFTLAVDRELSTAQRQAVKNGDKSIVTADFVSFSMVGSSVKTLRDYFPKGKAAHIVAHFTTYTVTNQQTGQTEYKYNFDVDRLDFVVQDSKQLQNGGTAPAQNQSYQQAPPQNYQQQQGYQQNPQQNYAPQQNYQQAPQQNYQPQQNQAYRPPQQNQQVPNGFEMFDEADSPF